MENYWKLPTKNTWRCICWGFDSCNQFGTRCVGWIGSLLGFMAYWDLERCYLGSLIQQESWGWEVCFWGDVNRLDGLEYFFCAWVEVVSLSEMLCKRHFFLVKLPKRVCLFFVGDFFVPERLWEDDFRILAFGIFFSKWKVKKKHQLTGQDIVTIAHQWYQKRLRFQGELEKSWRTELNGKNLLVVWG